jgi:hypothetical protein
VAKTLYFDCFSGASGDMVVGALLDLGLPLDALQGALGSLAIDYGGVSSDRVLRAGVSATKFRVHAEAREHEPVHAHEVAPGHAHDHAPAHVGEEPDRADDHGHKHGRKQKHKPDDGHKREKRHKHTGHKHHHAHEHGRVHAPTHEHDRGHVQVAHGHQAHRSVKEIAGLIERSALSQSAQARAVAMFERLAEAEAAIHAMPVERVHLHEVGAVDSIIDVVGAVYGMEWLGADRILSSPLNVGGGTVRCAHGTFPVPAPATARLLRDVPIYSGQVATELVTPTGALIVTEYATSFGPIPVMRVQSIGYGAGDKDFRQAPNVLRMLVGESDTPAVTERIVSIECEIDDMNPQLFGPLMDALHEAGALDVFYAPVQMKKGRPGTLVTVIAHPERREAIAARLFADTTTIGVSYHEMERVRLDREFRSVETPVGPIRFKLASRAGRIVNASPEFDDCARAAAEHRLPIKEVQAIAVKAWLDSNGTR